VAQNGILAGILVLLLVFPSELFNSTYEKHHGRVERAVARMPWLARLRRRRERIVTTGQEVEPPRGSAMRALRYGVVLLAGGVIAGFLDPKFGANRASVTLVVGLVAAGVFSTAVSGGIGRGYRQARKLPTQAVLEAIPSGLVIAAVGVVISRLVHFEPGYLYGIVGGLAFVTALDEQEEGRSQFVQFIALLAVALVAWFAFVPVSAAANRTGASPLVQVADAVLAAAFIGGVEKVLFGLVPIEVLPGKVVARWSWWAWGVAAFAAAFLFVDVLLRPESGYLGDSSNTSAVVIYSLFVLFGLASVAFWAWFRLRPDDPSGEGEGADEGDGAQLADSMSITNTSVSSGAMSGGEPEAP
jgi:hypothetical protein